jgi:hypothetical protein
VAPNGSTVSWPRNARMATPPETKYLRAVGELRHPGHSTAPSHLVRSTAEFEADSRDGMYCGENGGPPQGWQSGHHGRPMAAVTVYFPGLMFWLVRKRLVGSYLALIAANCA